MPPRSPLVPSLISAHRDLSPRGRAGRWISLRGLPSLSVICLGLLASLVACGGSGDGSAPDAASAPEVAVETSDLSLEEILQSHREALGGDALDAVETVRKVGVMDSSAFSGAPAETQIRDGKGYRRDVESPRGKILSGYDGSGAWSKGATPDQVEPVWLEERDQILYASQSDVDGPLVNPEASGHEVELVGKVGDAYRLRVRLGGQVERVVDLDASTFLIRAHTETRTFPQGTLDLQVKYSEYREVNGVQFAGRVATSMPEIRFDQALIWSEIETGVELDDSVFAFPGEAAP
ncbi:MAG: hypothetical protein AAGD01_19270 [Acidobacteriota bacterium]